MMDDLRSNPVLAIYIGQAILGLIFLLGAYWIIKRLNFLVAMLMRETLKQAEESKAIADVLAAETKETAQKISVKVEQAAAKVKDALAEQRMQTQVIPPGSVINMEVKTMDVAELNVPADKNKKES